MSVTKIKASVSDDARNNCRGDASSPTLDRRKTHGGTSRSPPTVSLKISNFAFAVCFINAPVYFAVTTRTESQSFSALLQP